MKPSRLILSLSCLAAGTLVLWMLLRTDADPNRTSEAKVPSLAVPSPRQSAQSTAPSADKGAPPDWGTPEFEKWVTERCAKWLESRGRDSAGLVALWDLSGDEALLLEAAEKFPDDPRVCAAMIGHQTMKGGAALPWAERLIALEPNNPAGHYWKATLLAQARKPEEALAALSAGSKVKGAPDQYLRARIVTAREAVLASGGSVKEAARTALMGPFSKTGQPVLGGKINSALRDSIAQAKESGNGDRLVEAASVVAAAAEHMRQAGAPSLMSDLVTQGMLLTTLKELPPETEYGNGEKTVGERMAEIEEERTRTKELMEKMRNRGSDILEGLTDAQAAEYTDRVILHGESEAMRWLDGILTPPPAK